MKANQKFREQDDAVSPVIAVILMVAITVVLAATVYVWVSGFSSGGQAAQSISLQSAKRGSLIEYTVTAASPGLSWNELKFSVAGISTAFQIVTSDGDASTHGTTPTFQPASTSTIDAGDQIYILNGDTSALSGVELTILDLNANSVMTKVEGGQADAGAATDPTVGTPSRVSGAAGTFTAGVTRVTLDRPIDMGTLAVTDLVPNNAHVMGTSTITVRSPTVFDINWNTGSTVAALDTITIAAGAVNDQTGAATAGAMTIAITASV